MKHDLISRLPADHFGAKTNDVLRLVQNGENCVITGIPGYGMEFFAKHVLNTIKAAIPDTKTLLTSFGMPGYSLASIKSDLMDTLGLTACDQNQLRKHLSETEMVLILAEIHHAPDPEILQFLDFLRFVSNGLLRIVSVCNTCIYSEAQQFQSLTSDVFNTIVIIPPFTLEGTRRIVELNNNEFRWNTPTESIPTIFKMSGGSPALIKYICMALYEEGKELLEYPHELIEIQPLRKRLADIAEIIPLLTRKQLEYIGLLTSDGKIFSGLLKEYLSEKDSETVIFNEGYNLTSTELKLFKLFLSNRNTIIDKDRISLLLGQDLNSYSEWAIYKSIARLREKLPSSFSLVTKKGLGWMLM